MAGLDIRRFEAIFDAHGATVLAYALRRTDRPAAEDALSETFLVAWRRRDDLPAEPLPWLYAIARNVLANQRRVDGRRRALVQKLGRDRSGVAPGLPLGDGGPVMRGLRKLSVPDREVLLLDAWEQLSSTDAGEVLGISPEAYRARLSRAKQRLRRVVEDDAGQMGESGGASGSAEPADTTGRTAQAAEVRR